MKIIQALITPNSYSRPQQKLTKVSKIVIHWVGNANSTAKANRDYFESLKNKKTYASAHYIIGLEGEILQCIPENEIAYHASSANGYSIGIENCHPGWDGKFNSKTYGSLIELCAMLCKKYGLNPKTDIIRHYDVTKKICPKYYVNNAEAWEMLKKDVEKKVSGEQEDQDLIQAIKAFNKYGIDIDIKVWGNVKSMNMKYAKLMIEKIGKGFGVKSYKETIEYLVNKGCINSKEVWIKEKFVPEYCRALLIKIHSTLIK